MDNTTEKQNLVEVSAILNSIDEFAGGQLSMVIGLTGHFRNNKKELVNFEDLRRISSGSTRNLKLEEKTFDKESDKFLICIFPCGTNVGRHVMEMILEFIYISGIVPNNTSYMLLGIVPNADEVLDLSCFDWLNCEILYDGRGEASPTLIETSDFKWNIRSSRKQHFASYEGETPPLFQQYPRILEAASLRKIVTGLQLFRPYDMNVDDIFYFIEKISYGNIELKLPDYITDTRNFPNMPDAVLAILGLSNIVQELDMSKILSQSGWELSVKNIEDATAVCEIWKATLDDFQLSIKPTRSSSFHGSSSSSETEVGLEKLQRLGKALGIDTSIDAYFAGIPLEDVIG